MVSIIDRLIHEGVLKTPSLIRAFQDIAREDFVPQELSEDARSADAPLPIGKGQTVSQPWTVAFMLELLQPEFGQKILDIGAGSGWQTALLAHIVSKAETRNHKSETLNAGRVYAMERIPELCVFGKANVARRNFIEKGIVEWFCRDATNGLPEYAPFDRIIAAASARALPDAWRQQCRVEGVIVAPIRESVWRFKKIGENKWEEKEYPGFVFVPFVSNH